MVKEHIKNKVKEQTELPGNRIVIWCDRLIFWLLLATVFIIPIYFNIYSFDQFEMPKLTLLRLLTCAMLALWAVKTFETGKFEFTPTPLDFPLIAWVVMNIVTTVSSFAPALSFRGEYENFAGSLSNINYVIIYYLAVNAVKDKKHLTALTLSAMLSGVFVTLYATAQYFGFDFIKWNEGSMIQGRYFASMGNPNFLGAFLIMIIPFYAAYFITNLRSKKYSMLVMLGIMFILSYIALVGTQSRGPFLGFIASILALLAYWMYNQYKDKSVQPEFSGKPFKDVFMAGFFSNKRLIATALSVILVAGVLSATFGRDATKRIWNTLTHLNESFSTSRLHIWLPALKIIKEYPVFGTGVDTFKTVFPKFEGVDFAQIDGANVSSRTAHNELLNIGATMGLTSLGIYLLLITAFLLAWISSHKRLTDPDLKLISMAVISAFTAYFVQNLFSFGVAAINTLLYVLFAVQMYLYNSGYGVKQRAITLLKTGGNGFAVAKTLLQAVSIAVFLYAGYMAYSIYSADVHYNRGKIYGNYKNDWKNAVTEHIESVKEAPGEVKYPVYLGLAYERYANQITDKPAQIQLLHKALDAYSEGVKLNSGNSYYWGNLGRTYFLLAKAENPSYLEQAIQSYRTAIEKAPVTGIFYNNLIEIYLAVGSMENAMPLIQQLTIYDKKLAANSYFMLGNFYFGKRNLAEAEVAYRKSLEMDPDLTQSYYNLGIVCAERRDKECVKYCMETFLAKAPDTEMSPKAREILGRFR